jgi:hypothetical protein
VTAPLHHVEALLQKLIQNSSEEQLALSHPPGPCLGSSSLIFSHRAAVINVILSLIDYNIHLLKTKPTFDRQLVFLTILGTVGSSVHVSIDVALLVEGIQQSLIPIYPVMYTKTRIKFAGQMSIVKWRMSIIDGV